MNDSTLPAPGTPTQVAHPGRATLRTVVATTVSALLTLAAVLPIMLAILGEELGAYIPEGAATVIIAVVAFIVALAAAVTRIMAIPGLQPWLIKIGLGTGVEKEQGRHAG